jgi:hypothetical protein
MSKPTFEDMPGSFAFLRCSGTTLRRVSLMMLLALAMFWSTAPMASDHFFAVYHEASQRHAIVELDGPVAYLYITEPGGQKPARDVAIFAVVPLVDASEAKAIAEKGNPPPLSKQHASESALQTAAAFGELALIWSQDGNSVGVTLRGEPWAFVSADAEKGFLEGDRESWFLRQPVVGA